MQIDKSVLNNIFTTAGSQQPDSGVGTSAELSEADEAVLSAVEQREFSEPYHHFVEICLSKAPSLRPNPARLLNHTFFKQCRRGHHSLAAVLAPYLSNQPASAINHGMKWIHVITGRRSYLFFVLQTC
jgi:hypothetical protein